MATSHQKATAAKSKLDDFPKLVAVTTSPVSEKDDIVEEIGSGDECEGQTTAENQIAQDNEGKIYIMS